MTTPKYKQGTVGCAASAIVYSLAKAGYYGASPKHNIGTVKGEKMWFQKATELQSILGWEEAVLVSQIGDFVAEYPTHRIVVVDLALKSSIMADWKGLEYVKNDDAKIVFLHYSTTDLHFSAISSIKEFVKRKGSTYKWCFDCSSYYSSASTTRNCYCDLPDQIPKPRKKLNCQHCGLDYSQGSKDICFHSQCQNCALAFEKKSDNMLLHRCPIFMGKKTMPVKFNGEPDFDFETLIFCPDAPQEDHFPRQQKRGPCCRSGCRRQFPTCRANLLAPATLPPLCPCCESALRSRHAANSRRRS
jgi:hypothetical protein